MKSHDQIITESLYYIKLENKNREACFLKEAQKSYLPISTVRRLHVNLLSSKFNFSKSFWDRMLSILLCNRSTSISNSWILLSETTAVVAEWLADWTISWMLEHSSIFCTRCSATLAVCNYKISSILMRNNCHYVLCYFSINNSKSM